MAVDGCLDDDEMLAFAMGKLPSSRRRAVIEHVDGCESCRELAAELARGDDDVEAAEADDAPAGVPSLSRLAGGEVVSGRFLLDEPLGKGASATVFRAKDKVLGVDVALKLVRRDARGEAKRAFARELKVGRKIAHPNVCKLFDTGSTDVYEFISMELVEGKSLAQVLAAGELPKARALEILRGIAAGLGAAHALGVVHRDLKPANVMIEGSTGRVVLTDFGLAMDLDTKQSRKLVGTPAYWAPEQARGEPATPRSDVYSFGVLAHRLLAGKDFSMSDGALLDAIPRELRRVVERCLELHPRDRFESAREIEMALAASTGGSAKRLRLATGVAAMVVLATLGVWMVRQREPVRPDTPAMPMPSPSPNRDPSLSPSPNRDPNPSATPSMLTQAPSAEPTPAASLSAASPVRPVVGLRPVTRPSAAPSAGPPVAPPTEGDLLYRK